MQLERAQTIEEFVKSIGERDFQYEFNYLRQITETKEHNKKLFTNDQVQRLNRFSNILPFSHTIVKPEFQTTNQFCTPKEKFYINANYIKGINNAEKYYIATQGPIPESIDDFWHMIWTNNVGVVIMLCTLYGRGSLQSFTLLSSNKAQYGPYEVNSILLEENPQSLLKNKIILKCQEEEREIIHYQWTDWEDFGVVEDDQFKIVDLLAEISNTAANAGVGRTGTFIAICQLKQLLINNRAKISIFCIARRIREQRSLMIQKTEFIMWLIKKLKYI